MNKKVYSHIGAIIGGVIGLVTAVMLKEYVLANSTKLSLAMIFAFNIGVFFFVFFTAFMLLIDYNSLRNYKFLREGIIIDSFELGMYVGLAVAIGMLIIYGITDAIFHIGMLRSDLVTTFPSFIIPIFAVIGYFVGPFSAELIVYVAEQIHRRKEEERRQETERREMERREAERKAKIKQDILDKINEVTKGK